MTTKSKTKKSKTAESSLALLDLLNEAEIKPAKVKKTTTKAKTPKTVETTAIIVRPPEIDPSCNLGHTLTYKPLDYERDWITIPVENNQARNQRRSIEIFYRVHNIKVQFK